MRTILSSTRTRLVCALAIGLLFHFAEPAFAEGHRFACADYTQGKVFIVAADGKVEWEHPTHRVATNSGCCRMAICSSRPATA